MQPVAAAAHVARRDPAPTRWQYRMQRLWLTPLFRVAFRVGLPAFLITFAAGIYLSDADRREAMTSTVTSVLDSFQKRPEFMVSLVAVEGCAPELADAIRARLDLKLPLSSFDIDMQAVHDKVADFDAVADADVRLASGGILQIDVTERVPVAIWRMGETLTMLDATGHRVAGLAARGDRPDLPLIAGEGADEATPEALQIVIAAGPLLPRLRGLVRQSDRRWDIVLDRNQRILLPADDPVPALERMIALDQAEDLLARDILAVDLRNQQRPVLRLTPFTLREMRRAQGIDVSEDEL